MAFGQPSGPPASRQQLQELLGLLQLAGHSDFRDARGPMGFNQRQGAGKFTRDEADAFIGELQAAADAGAGGDAGVGTSEPAASAVPTVAAERRPTPARRPTPPAERLSAAEQTLRRMTSEQLAGELQRRGWAVMEP
jgi:hypothetical protein